MKKFLLILSLFLTMIIPSGNAIDTDSTQISLLTISPRNKAVYTVYGHTALRVRNVQEGIDLVFNYGMFDSNKPYFLYYFVKGETDYWVSADDFRHFKYAYSSAYDNATVIEQVLNFPEKEKAEILRLLEESIRPENREYRYNYFFDNCTTRPRDIIENNCGGILKYNIPETEITFRDLVHECTSFYPWMTFGIDLLIGAGADSLISHRNEMFLPVKLMEGLDRATITNSTSTYPFVLESNILIQGEEETPEEQSFFLSPIGVGILLLIGLSVFSFFGFRNRKPHGICYCLLFSVAAIAGCIVFFVSFFSVHPCTFPNYNLLWCHPLHWIAAIGYCFKKTYPLIRWFHRSNFVLLSFLLIGWYWIPQQLNMASVPFILCLWLGSGYFILSEKRIVAKK